MIQSGVLLTACRLVYTVYTAAASQSHLRATARAASTVTAVVVTANATVPRRRGAAPSFEGDAAAGTSVYKKRMAATRLWHQSASPTSRARCNGALHSATQPVPRLIFRDLAIMLLVNPPSPTVDVTEG